MFMNNATSPLLAGMGRLKSYVRKRMRDPDGVEDVVQETLARVMEQERRQAIEHPLAYAFRVADSVIVGDLRKSARAGGRADGRRSELDLLELACDLPLADEVLDYRERFARFEAALARLTPMRRTVFRLRHVDGKSRQEIAAELGLSLEAVKKHLVRAMADLAQALEGDLDTAAEGQENNG